MVVTAPAFAGAPLLYGRCDPYGAESGGPKRVMGGLHGAGSARVDTADLPGLPQNVVEGEWTCPQPAVIRVRMTCRCNHVGAIMDLCSWHDEETWASEMVAGVIRRHKTTVRTRGHYEEIQRRQAGACPRCLFPGKHAEDYKALFAWQQELAYLREMGGWISDRAEYVRAKIQAIVDEFDAGNASGTIHRCPMRLVPVS